LTIVLVYSDLRKFVGAACIITHAHAHTLVELCLFSTFLPKLSSNPMLPTCLPISLMLPPALNRALGWQGLSCALLDKDTGKVRVPDKSMFILARLSHSYFVSKSLIAPFRFPEFRFVQSPHPQAALCLCENASALFKGWLSVVQNRERSC
jgi:hypothetical protein